MQTGKILIVEDSAALALTYSDYLTRAGHSADIAGSVDAAQRALARLRYDCVLMDLNLPDGNGTALIADMRSGGIDTPVVVLTAEPSIDTAVAAIRAGAQDYLCKPVTAERLNLTLGHVLEQQALRRIVSDYRAIERDRFCDFIGASPAMQIVYHVLENAAQSRAPVFITGESGTGKELAARAIHTLSPRRGRVFEALNCAAVPGNLLESEIFGHARGAFTGAVSRYAGAAERAQDGTLLLDELPEMQPEMQSKLLRFTQSGAFRALGAARETVVDVRFVCATNRDPLAAVASGILREDLYYRLNVISLHLPPLRERGDDVLLIAAHLLTRMAAEEHKHFTCLSGDAADYLCSQSWPGNVRQLQNVLRRAVVMNDGDILTADMLPPRAVCNKVLPSAPVLSAAPSSAAASLREMERQMIERTIDDCGGNISAAARRLGVNPSTLHRKREKWRRGGSGEGGIRGRAALD
ncbi:MAG: sigma-54 dependent transcriptional regulator [Alphaproteobacteria bacterium]|nr:sigma-54 dependent transcriptional regulator [Alphaproteobacteria bacterium]